MARAILADARGVGDSQHLSAVTLDACRENAGRKNTNLPYTPSVVVVSKEMALREVSGVLEEGFGVCGWRDL